MPIFTTVLQRNVETLEPQAAVKIMADYIRSLQDDLEHRLTHLDSSNIVAIDADETEISSSSGSVDLSGNYLKFSGKNGETFEVGIGTSGAFQFKLNGKSGAQIFYLTSEGELIIADRASVSIDGGEW